MKKLTTFIIFILGTIIVGAQNYSELFDISPGITQFGVIQSSRDTWDTVFIYQLPQAPPTTTAAETDGNHLYITGWNSAVIHKWDMQGNFIQTFTIDSIDDIRDLAYDGQYYYGACPLTISNIYVLDFDNQVCVDTIQIPYGCRALAYNDDDSVFYSNNWSNDIIVFTHDGTIVDTIFRNAQTHLYASYYGLAYDNWSTGGPYLWAFSQEGPYNGTLVQLELPSGQETGFYKDVGGIALGSVAGGLFTYPDYDSSIAVIGGVMQNAILFGFELAPVTPPPASYDIGGNLSASATSLDEGEVNLYRIHEGSVEEQFTTGVDNSGNYLFTEMIEGDYMIHAKPEAGSITADDYVPTYHDGNIHWEDVSTVYINENSLENDIELVEMSELGNGIGFVNGHVYDISGENEPPVVNAQVMLMNASGECIAIAYTDEEGSFSFNDIALESYGLIVEIPGKVMEPMSFLLTEPEPGLAGVILYVTDGSIMVGIETEFPAATGSISRVYPNPSREQAKLNIMLDKRTTTQIRIVTASGQLVQNNYFDLNSGQNQIILDLKNLKRGLYYVILESDNGLIQTRKLIKTK